MDFEFLSAFEEDWQPVSKAALTGWLVFYGIFFLYILSSKTGYLLTDYIFLPIHEAGTYFLGGSARCLA